MPPHCGPELAFFLVVLHSLPPQLCVGVPGPLVADVAHSEWPRPAGQGWRGGKSLGAPDCDWQWLHLQHWLLLWLPLLKPLLMRLLLVHMDVHVDETIATT